MNAGLTSPPFVWEPDRITCDRFASADVYPSGSRQILLTSCALIHTALSSAPTLPLPLGEP